MTYELIDKYPAADEREQIGKFLRHAFPLALGSFTDLPGALEIDQMCEAAKLGENCRR